MKKQLEQIHGVKDLRHLPKDRLPALADEIRAFILDTLSVKPGHLGAGLGVVELSIALHYYFNTPEDKLVWDVGHQSYPHKILTGRKEQFGSLRQRGGISGFPCREESEFDTFGTGHSSTSISAITGMAAADRLHGNANRHIAVIGDASIVSGMAIEGLNHLGSTDLDVLIILNDNSIGIDPVVGALKNHFFELFKKDIPAVFEDFGFHYEKEEKGHDFEALFSAFEKMDSIKGPKLLHIKTVKGKGFPRAEANQTVWHSPGQFDKLTGEIRKNKKEVSSWQEVFGTAMMELMNSNPNIAAITPAMLTGSHLTELREAFPERVFDVGIAEQHAVTFSAGLAAEGIIPYCTIYSTFLQRAYDQVIHDVALQKLPVVFCIDRAGIVGTDGATHHGMFDISILNSIPNMIVSAPADAGDFRNLLYTAQFTELPFSVRFHRGSTGESAVETTEFKRLEVGKAVKVKSGSEIAILAFGPLAVRVEKILEDMPGADRFGLYKFLFSKPLDTEMLERVFKEYGTIVTFEDGIENGGFGDSVMRIANRNAYPGKIHQKAYPDHFIPHGSVEELERELELDESSIRKFLQKLQE